MKQRNQKSNIKQQLLKHLLAIICFLGITFAYFSPLLEGKVLPQSDTQQYKGMSQELREFYKEEGQSSAWTGSMFSGMPAYQIGIWGGAPNFLDYLEAPLKALGSTSAGPIFTSMLMAYILFCIMGVGFFPALLGAIAYGLSSYNIIILDAGHVTKAWAIAYMPLIVAAFVAAIKKHYLLSGSLMAIGLALQIKSNHLQITYYTALLSLFLFIGLLISFLLQKQAKALLKTLATLVAGTIIAVLCNLGTLYGNYEMSKESTRGKSDLVLETKTNDKQSAGLEKEYAFAWSYGKMETLSLLIPNINGGASGGMLSPDSHLYRTIKTNMPEAQLPTEGFQAQTYWGDQPFTSGPVYLGATICFLFVLGMFVIKSRLKWVLFFATLFFILLSWGHNLAWFNDWFFYHFPMYNKFRAVSTALVVPTLTILIVAIWGLKEFINQLNNVKAVSRNLYWALGISGGFCLLLYLVPTLLGFNFISINDIQWKDQVPDWYFIALLNDRKSLLTSDALRSLIYIVLTGIVLFGILKVKNRKQALIWGGIALVILVLSDLWTIDKRYLNNDKFQNKHIYNVNKPFSKTEADNIILEDNNVSYRVLNLNNPFNETRTSYFHKSIGGYHAAKLRRYQELIDYYLQTEVENIQQSFATQNIDSITNRFSQNVALNMLNAKYIVFDPTQPPLINPYAMGNAWLVSDYKLVNSANDEIANLSKVNLQSEAIIHKENQEQLRNLNLANDTTAKISLVEYKPNKLVYEYEGSSEQLAIFSEIYYANGWESYIDGSISPHFRADWTLRAMRIPAGKHKIEFKFVPHGYNKARLLSSIASGLLLLLLISTIIYYPLSRRKQYQNKK